METVEPHVEENVTQTNLLAVSNVKYPTCGLQQENHILPLARSLNSNGIH